MLFRSPVALAPDAAPLSNPENSVRAVLPAVQALADLALGIRLEGPSPTPAPFQVLGVTVTAVAASATSPSAMEIKIQLSDPLLVVGDPEKTLTEAVQLLMWDGATSPWQQLTHNSTPHKLTAVEISGASESPAIRLKVEPAWTAPTSFQVVLRGTGPGALLAQSAPPRPLAGVAGEVVPPGSGRDAFLFGT